MKIQYANEFVQKLGMGDPTTYVYQIIYYENENDDRNIIQYFILHRLVICIKAYSYVAHMFHACSFSENTAVPKDIKQKKCFLSLNENNTIFA